MPLACHPLVSKVGGGRRGGREEGVAFTAELCLPYLHLCCGKKREKKKTAAEKSGLFLRAAGCREGDTL